mmetsp:Transcript_23501/g.21373  ORF Transcript_23501/g.21373 Transcript_23501/m.21373 type:complete len:119 (-) Transcript_23501:32-388(-)
MVLLYSIIIAVVTGPLIAVLSGISLVNLQRGLEAISSIAKTPQKGVLRQLKPYFKQLDLILDNAFGGSKFTISPTNILLMGVIILLLALLLENSEKPKEVVVRKKTTTIPSKSEDKHD